MSRKSERQENIIGISFLTGLFLLPLGVVGIIIIIYQMLKGDGVRGNTIPLIISICVTILGVVAMIIYSISCKNYYNNENSKEEYNNAITGDNEMENEKDVKDSNEKLPEKPSKDQTSIVGNQISCDYCGVAVDSSTSRCPGCGARCRKKKS